MKHATPDTLSQLEPLLLSIRKFSALREKKPGTFYHKSQAFLHFHEHGAQTFADLKTQSGWLRFEISNASHYQDLLDAIHKILA